MKEKWLVQSKKADFNAIAQKYHISPITARIIRNRDVVEDEQIYHYLYGSLGELHSPWLLKDMEKAVPILLEKIQNHKHICVVGDYDIDGVSAGSILVLGIRMLGGEASFAVSDRIVDGYGINDRIVDEAQSRGADTIVTCDNGIAAAKVLERAKEMGMTVIVTDHHEVPAVLPEVDAVIDAKQQDCAYPYKEICGAVVAYKLVQAMFEKSARNPKEIEMLLELAAIATIGDVVDLQDENRIIAKYGLQLINQGGNPGIQALCRANHLEDREITAYHIGFVIGPCLNAGGRLDTAMKSYQLLSGECEDVQKLADELAILNDERKAMTAKNTEEALSIIDRDTSYEEDTVLVVYLPGCHESLAGIVAGRLRECYYKPAFVFTPGDGMLKGSGRSIEGYHMYRELEACSCYIEKFGGHAMAAGLSVKEENLPELRAALNRHSELTQEDLTKKVWIDVPLPFSYVTPQLTEELKCLEPFGKANPKPVFAEKNVSIRAITILGQNRNVIRLRMENERGDRMDGTYFCREEEFMQYMREQYTASQVERALRGQSNSIKVSITYYPEVSKYYENTYIRVVIGKIL